MNNIGYLKFLVIGTVLLVFTIGITPLIPFSDAAAAGDINAEDSETQCREGQVLVFRTIANSYACVSENTAKKWVEYEIAEIVGESEEKEDVMESMNDGIDYEKELSLLPEHLTG